MPPRRRGPHGAAVPAPNENRGEIEQLRRQVEMLTRTLAQLEAPTQEDDTFDTEDFFENPFHNQAQPRQQKRSSFHAGNAHDNRQHANQRYGVGSGCYKCGKPGHTSADCRKVSVGCFDLGRQLLVEEEPKSGAELEIQPVYDEGIDEIEEEDILYGDSGEALVLCNWNFLELIL
ncbi:hypothetical protein F0562_033599 [Nyssa sinensis]|uniref:CCHC-type domain-containing protein n=1 Tax=Nyssa sinensis TaxID=561372 RepID=A0A5J5AD83_9ASTE|nr:hypothetical protein F0562_033599 [Nyssa sinensis]